jgi:excisionase family DNA binding protein
MPKVDEGTLWLRLGEAADYLGVHPVTLRRWADERRIACIRTPGGRRRFLQADLDDFVTSSRNEVLSKTPPTTALLPLSPISFAPAQVNLRDQSWFAHMDEHHRMSLRGQGQKLMATLMHYIARDEGGEAYLQEGERLAIGYAGLFLHNGLNLPDVINAFMRIRRSITNSLREVGQDERPPDHAAHRLHHRTEDFLDHVLLAIVNVYQDAKR